MDNQLDFDLKAYAPLLATMYGEGANQDYDSKVNLMSTFFNRAKSGKKEFGADTGKMSDILQRGYYAYSQKSPKFMEAIEQKFPDEMSKKSYREFQVILSGMLRGKIQPTRAEFFLTPKEITKINKNKSMNMNLLEEVGKNKTWKFMAYKTPNRAGKASKSK